MKATAKTKRRPPPHGVPLARTPVAPEKRAASAAPAMGHRLALVLAGLLGALFGLHRLIDPDLFVQIAVGRSILAHPSSVGVSSFIAAYPAYPYVEDKWLASTLAALADRIGGEHGVMLYQIALCLAVAAAWYLMQRRWGGSTAVALVGTALALVTCSFRLEPRPDTISHGLLALVITLVGSRQPMRRAVWVVPLVLALWVNLHGYFINGLLVLAAAAVAGALGDRDLVPTRDRPLGTRERFAILGLAVLACFVHPQGWRAVASPFQQLLDLNGDAAFRAAIQELQPSTALFAEAGYLRLTALAVTLVGAIGLAFTRMADRPLVRQGVALAAALPWLVWAPPGLSSLAHRMSMALFVMAAFEVPVAVREQRYFCSLVFVGFTVLALPVVRNVPLLTPAALILLSPAWTAAAREVAVRYPRQHVQQLATVGVVGFVLVVGWLRLADRLDTSVRAPSRTGWGIDRERFPAGAADFLARSAASDPILNNFDSGGYLLYRLHPAHRVFIAGNTSMFPPSFLAYYRTTVSGAAVDLEDVTQRYAPRSAVLDLTSPASDRLAAALAVSSAWRLVFFDRSAAVFVRSDESTTPLDVAGRTQELLADDSGPVLPYWLGGKRLPYPSFNLALFLAAIGRPDLTVDESQRLWPLAKSEDIAVFGGKAARDSGRLIEYLPVLEDAAQRYLDSEATQNLLFLALAFRADRALNTGAVPAAEQDLHRMIDLQPGNCGPYFALAKAAVLRGDTAEARRVLLQGRSYDRDGVCIRTALQDPAFSGVLQK